MLYNEWRRINLSAVENNIQQLPVDSFKKLMLEISFEELLIEKI